MTHPSRRPLMSGNWKMHLTHLDAIQVVQKLVFRVGKDDFEKVDVSVHPPFTALRSIQTLIDSDDLPLALGAQNCHDEDKGAFTGEVSPSMLAKLSCRYVIVGHSERRQLFGESNDFVNRKVRAVLAANMTPILCVGETLEQREAGGADGAADVVCAQLVESLAKVSESAVASMVVAYEPIWAIGTGRTATPADAQAMCAAVRHEISNRWGDDAATGVRIQYGGSVKAVNVRELMAEPDIDGALVGGASLDPDEFARIVAFWKQ